MRESHKKISLANLFFNLIIHSSYSSPIFILILFLFLSFIFYHSLYAFPWQIYAVF